MTGVTLEQIVPIFKKCLDLADSAPVLKFLNGMSAKDMAELRPALLEFVQAERARLVKLRTLGLTAGFDDKAGMIDVVLAHLKRVG